MCEIKQDFIKETKENFSNGHEKNLMATIDYLSSDLYYNLFTKSNNSLPVVFINCDNHDVAKRIRIYLELLISKLGERNKSRLLVKRGTSNMALRLSDVALIYTKDKLVYVIDRDSKKYTIGNTVTELEKQLDQTIFFRANRQYIVNINFIKGFKPFQKVKLLLDMDIPHLEEPIIISQMVAPAFKKWMNDA